MWWLRAFLFAIVSFQGEALVDLGWENDLDLTTFVTRPELRAPLFDVTLYEPERVTPGYWFVAPYTELEQPNLPEKYFQACQTGPHIYDGNGDLIYSGACDFGNQNTCDFRAWNFNGEYYLSAILYMDSRDPTGRGVLMDSSYRIINVFTPDKTEHYMNMHELKILDSGDSALFFAQRTELVNTTDLNIPGIDMGYILNVGFRQVDVRTGETQFEWWAHPEVSLAESTRDVKNLGPWPVSWNWFHGNSVDKNSDGDYILSARFTDAIYKISGSTGKILWRLGGTKSDFKLLGFNFSRQHDAHWIEEECSSGIEVITLLDNGGDEHVNSSTFSSAMKIELNQQTMTAAVVQRWIRPDQDRSLLRANFQRLGGTDNWLAGWSDNAYLSEHTTDGRLLMEAEFASKRMVTYRTYKMNFTGTPTEPPAVKSFVYGSDPDNSVTVSYVSWNGATEVDRWEFYNSNGDLIGDTQRQGFETRLMSNGAQSRVYAQAIAVNGSVLGRSDEYRVEIPFEWIAKAQLHTEQAKVVEGDSAKTEL